MISNSHWEQCTQARKIGIHLVDSVVGGGVDVIVKHCPVVSIWNFSLDCLVYLEYGQSGNSILEGHSLVVYLPTLGIFPQWIGVPM